MGFLDSMKSGIGKTVGACLGVILIIFVIGVLAGVGSGSSPNGGASTSGASNQKALHQFNEAFNVGGLTLQFSNLRRSESITKYGSYETRAREGAEYLVFDVSVKNNGKKTEQFYSGRLLVLDSQEREFNVAGGTDEDGRMITDSGIQPGLSAHYVDFYVEVPTDATGLILAVYENGVWKTGRQDVQIIG